jgi:hypothetical protein
MGRLGKHLTGFVIGTLSPPRASYSRAIPSSLTHCVDFAHDKPLFSVVAIVLWSLKAFDSQAAVTSSDVATAAGQSR